MIKIYSEMENKEFLKNYDRLKCKEMKDFINSKNNGKCGLFFFLSALNNEENQETALNNYKKGASLLDPLCFYKLSLIFQKEEKEISQLCYLISACLMPRGLLNIAILAEAQKRDFQPILTKSEELFGLLEERFEIQGINQLFWIKKLLEFYLQPSLEKYKLMLDSIEFWIERAEPKFANLALQTIFYILLSDREQLNDFHLPQIMKIIRKGWKHPEGYCERLLDEIEILEVLKIEKPFLIRFSELLIEVGQAVKYLSSSSSEESLKRNLKQIGEGSLQTQARTNLLFFEIIKKLYELRSLIKDDLKMTFILRYLSECFEKG